VAAGGLDPRIAGRTGALSDVMMQQGDWQVLERGKRALQIIVGTVIDDDDLEVRIGLGAHALQCPANFVGPVVDRDNDADQGILLGLRHYWNLHGCYEDLADYSIIARGAGTATIQKAHIILTHSLRGCFEAEPFSE
jgi:hypothetical protein